MGILINFVKNYEFSLQKKLVLPYKSHQSASDQEIDQISEGD